MIHAALGGLGIELARAHRPDLVLLDLHLPDQSGRDVLRTLKRRADTEDIPVVVLSADASPGLANLYLSGALSKSLERLSTGLKVNRGADGPAALVISEKQRAQIAGLRTAIDNTNKAVSLVQTGEGALNEMNSLLTKEIGRAHV